MVLGLKTSAQMVVIGALTSFASAYVGWPLGPSVIIGMGLALVIGALEQAADILKVQDV